MTMQEVTFRNVMIGGCSEPYTLVLPGITGLGIPDVQSAGDLVVPGMNGVVSGADTLGPRTLGVPISIWVKEDPDAAMAVFRTLKTAWRPAEYNEVLTLYLPGYGPADDTVKFYGRPRSAIEVDLAQQYMGMINVMASFAALDPVGYSAPVTTALGVGSTTISNPGDAPSNRATITLTGTSAAPTLKNNSDGERAIFFRSPIPTGETWTLDLHNRTLLDESGLDQFPAISPASVWFSFAPGDNDMLLSNASAGSVALSGGWW